MEVMVEMINLENFQGKEEKRILDKTPNTIQKQEEELRESGVTKKKVQKSTDWVENGDKTTNKTSQLRWLKRARERYRH